MICTGGTRVVDVVLLPFTQEKTKTLRVGIVNATMALCLPIGTGLSGILYRKLGFTGVYTIALVLCAVSVWMAHLCVRDTRQIKSATDKEHDGTCCARVRFFFDLKHVLDAFRVTFKKGKNNRKMKVIALTVLITGIMGPLQGKYRPASSTCCACKPYAVVPFPHSHNV